MIENPKNSSQRITELALELILCNSVLKSEALAMYSEHITPDLGGDALASARGYLGDSLEVWFEDKIPPVTRLDYLLVATVECIDWICVARFLDGRTTNFKADTKYEGYTNYMTATIAILLQQDKRLINSLYEEVKKRIRNDLDKKLSAAQVKHFATFLEAWYQAEVSKDIKTNYLFSNILMEGMKCVNWHEVAEVIIDLATN